MLTEIRVDALRETNSLVVHVEDAVVVLEEVNAQVCLAVVARWCDLQHAMPVSVDHVLMLRDNISCVVDGERQVRHRIELLDRAAGAPKTHWVQLRFACSILLVHNAKQVVHCLLWQGDKRGSCVWQHHSLVKIERQVTEFDSGPV